MNTNPLFINNWSNDFLFAYKTTLFSDLPDTISLQLINGNEKFYMNWYGSLSSSYGFRWGRKHEGLDIPLHTGDSVFSSFDGIVRFAKSTTSGYGNCVIIRHFNGLETLYGHLSKISVNENQFIEAGSLIGLGGSTGRSTGPHLHFETRYKDYSFNPMKIIDIKSKELISNDITFTKKELFPDHFIVAPPSPPKPIYNKSDYIKKSKNATISKSRQKGKKTAVEIKKKKSNSKINTAKPTKNKTTAKKSNVDKSKINKAKSTKNNTTTKKSNVEKAKITKSKSSKNNTTAKKTNVAKAKIKKTKP
jgi:hypothetical protein